MTMNDYHESTFSSFSSFQNQNDDVLLKNVDFYNINRRRSRILRLVNMVSRKGSACHCGCGAARRTSVDRLVLGNYEHD